MDGAKKDLPAVLTLRLKRLLSLRASRNALSFAYGFMTAFMFFTLFLALCNPERAPFSFSFSSSRTTAPRSSTSSSLLASSSYALPDPNVCASGKLNDGNRSDISKEKELNSDDVEHRQVDRPLSLKVQDDGNDSIPSSSDQREPNSASTIASPSSTGNLTQTVNGVSGDDAGSNGDSRLHSLDVEDELEKLLVAANERYNISAREREILRQYRYGAFVDADLEVERSPDSEDNMTSTPTVTLTGENAETERTPDSVTNTTSIRTVILPEENGTFTGNATNVVKRDSESEISPDSVSNMTSSPTVTLPGENGTFTGNATNVVKENDGDVPVMIQHAHGKRREGRKEGKREGRRSGWRIKTGVSSEGWRMKTDVRSEDTGRERKKLTKTVGPEKSKMECDIFDGRWVWDESYPHYPAGSCPYVETTTNCYQNGRPERNYEKWRWQPNGCNIPR